MKKLSPKFIKNFITILLVLAICFVLLFTLLLSLVITTHRQSLILLCVGVDIVMLALVLSNPEKHIDKIVKWITRNENYKK